MSVREGYKNTELGEIPDNWEIVTLESVLERFQNGCAFSSEGYVESGIPIVSMANISLKGIFQYDYTKAKYWNESELDRLTQYQLKKGSLLIAMTDVTPDKNLIGRMAVIDIDDLFLLNQRVGLLQTKPNINRKFLSEYGNFSIWRKYCKNVAASGAQANISTKDIKNGLIPVPPLKEQQKIADILSTVDQKINLINTKIKEAEILKKGLMQKLLSEGIGHIKFKESEIGQVPIEWEVLALSEFAKINMGQSPVSKFVNEEGEGIPFAQGNSEFTQKYFTHTSKYCIQPKKVAQQGDILFSVRAPVGDINIAAFDICIGRGLASLRAKNNEQEYLYQLLMKLAQRLNQSAQGSTFTAINKSDLEKLKIAVPPLEEQKRIADILFTADKKIETLRTKKELFGALKKGLVQKLITGEVRVNS
ncbi:restriction endonuclease subunit S [Sulfurovum sp. XGS-02]|uniref:restriction endonuclease subunit S n=1 Tax=Sulfurovum sp. XGS-02 TaxID=2925411 RepID=UPI0020548018|nr:restriction endonuclease subunit S [Sulfurovum sp. XGS-02]UPT78170.1 restriction endonuclease subunit S [Sulfurovum sp. XGS-02]